MLDHLDAPALTLEPDLTPQPLPSWDRIRQYVATARRWLALVAADAGDARQARARDMLAVDPATGRDRLEEVAARALRIAARTCGTEGEEIASLVRKMAEMTAGDQLYRYRQWSLGLDDMPGWLAQFLSFTSTVATSDKDDAAA